MTRITLKEMKARIAGLSEEQARAVVCALAGHSRVSNVCMGYRYCVRCEEQTGDSIASIDAGLPQAVVVDHGCETCVFKVGGDAKTLDWRDTFLLPEEAAAYLKELRSGAEVRGA